MTSRIVLRCVDSVLNLLLASGRIGVYTFSVVEDCIGEPTCSLADCSERSAKKRQSAVGVGVAMGVGLGLALDSILLGISFGILIGTGLAKLPPREP